MIKEGLALLAVAGMLAVVLTTSAPAASGSQTIQLLDVNGVTHISPFGENGPAGGDHFAQTDPLYKWAGTKRGARVGRLELFATFITGFGPQFNQRAKVVFQGQAYLPGGSIIGEGNGTLNPNGPSSGTLAVIGGTGKYASARGSLSYRDIGNGDTGKTALTIHLVP
jgi:hypothetical protein